MEDVTPATTSAPDSTGTAAAAVAGASVRGGHAGTKAGKQEASMNATAEGQRLQPTSSQGVCSDFPSGLPLAASEAVQLPGEATDGHMQGQQLRQAKHGVGQQSQDQQQQMHGGGRKARQKQGQQQQQEEGGEVQSMGDNGRSKDGLNSVRQQQQQQPQPQSAQVAPEQPWSGPSYMPYDYYGSSYQPYMDRSWTQPPAAGASGSAWWGPSKGSSSTTAAGSYQQQHHQPTWWHQQQQQQQYFQQQALPPGFPPPLPPPPPALPPPPWALLTGRNDVGSRCSSSTCCCTCGQDKRAAGVGDGAGVDKQQVASIATSIGVHGIAELLASMPEDVKAQPDVAAAAHAAAKRAVEVVERIKSMGGGEGEHTAGMLMTWFYAGYYLGRQPT